jgi:hypothetical protein
VMSPFLCRRVTTLAMRASKINRDASVMPWKRP